MNSPMSNMMSIDDHVDKINKAKEKVQSGIFEMAEAVTDAVSQLDGRQVELCKRLGMSKGTISKWVSIGSNRRLIKMKEKAPLSFNSLYQLSSLDNHYNKHYGQDMGEKKFLELFENKEITPLSQRNDVDKIIRFQKQIIKNATKAKIENITSFPKEENQPIRKSEMKLQVLIKSKLFFNTIIIVPSINQIEEWKSRKSNRSINEHYPLKNLENLDANIFQQCIVKVRAKDIDVAISSLENWGYNYSNILIPTQIKKALVGINQEYVIITGTKGQSKNVQSIIKSNKSVDLIKYAENIGIKPFLFVGEVVTAKNWVYCIA